MEKPDFVTRFEKEAEKIKETAEPLFSRGTYQFEVAEGQERYFPFLQIQDGGQVTDSFCSCKISEKGQGCPHLASAWLAIFGAFEEPLHVRFRHSFWNQCFQMAAKRYGYTAKLFFLAKEGGWTCGSKTRKRLFFIRPLLDEAKKKLEALLSPVKMETEETSLKFSNWSFEEMEAFKAGNGSHSIRYEFSFWSDLAKWLFFLQEGKTSYQIVFESAKGKMLPDGLMIHFDLLDVWFYLAEVSWPFLIPALSTVKSPLQVFEKEGRLKGAEYDPVHKRLLLHAKNEEGEKDSREGYSVGEWLFVKDQGFYRRAESPLFQKEEIEEKEIGQILSSAYQELTPFLPIHADGYKARYQLRFDLEGNLHIDCYLFEGGDLQTPTSVLFFPWVYLEKKGFFLVEDWLFEGKEKIIPKGEMADFINRHRVFLHQFPGFQTHLGSLESRLVYRMTEEKGLLFDAELAFPEQYEGASHFDEWVYILGFGFYLKRENTGRLPLHPGLLIEKEAIPSFIASHKEELEQVHGFFRSQCPVQSSGLEIGLNEEGLISVVPKWVYKEGIDPSKIEFFGDYLYFKGEGFSEIPTASKLPERFHHPIVIPQSQEGAFLSYELEPLRSYILQIDPRLKRSTSLRLKVRRVAKSRKEHEWLVDFVYESELGMIDPFSLWASLQERKKHLFSPAGLLNLKDPRFQWLRQIPKKKIDPAKGVIRLNTLEWMRLTLFEELIWPKGDDVDSVASRQLLAQLERLETDKILDISGLKASLRPYQEQGLAWLWFLYCHRLSGLLCDDMGLGKTHQTMALLAAVASQTREKGKKYLVVCPTSVIYHWEELLRKFLPEMRVCTYYGLARTLEHFEEEYDLLLTSYGILRMGRGDLAPFSFEIAIFDEVQIAKNRASQTHQALAAIRSFMRLGLTGTPIENRLKELKALFDLVLPSYLPSDVTFRDLFIQPIEKHGDEEKKTLLGRLVKPFILRRKKKDVLTDLPEKIEEISYCDLSPDQSKIYREVVSQMKGGVYQELKDSGKPIPYLHVFAALTTLKQICDHPALFHHTPRYEEFECGKWDLFVELLGEAMDSGQKVVVFSQYLDMLAIIENYLTKKKIGFASIKGSTRNRKEELLKFREDPECKVFVASLLAAGVGIDLTVASIVVHYDRWWNPAKENQATDRVHRIGQNRGVQVFKLITKGTIEEEIHTIIERKKGLLEDIVGAEDQITYLNRDELLRVFEKMFQNYDVN